MLQFKTVPMGKLVVTIFDFPEVGDILPMHEHDETTNHITVVSRGSFKIRCTGWEKQISAGSVLDWKPNDPHEFIALEPNSRLVNIPK